VTLSPLKTLISDALLCLPPHFLLHPTPYFGIFSHLAKLSASLLLARHNTTWLEYGIRYSELKLNNPALNQKHHTTPIIPALKKKCISPAVLGLLSGISVIIFTDHGVLHEQNSSIGTKLKDSCLFQHRQVAASLCLFPPSSLFPFFWKERSLNGSSCSSATLFYQQGSISCVWLLEITGKYKHYNQNRRHSLLPSPADFTGSHYRIASHILLLSVVSFRAKI